MITLSSNLRSSITMTFAVACIALAVIWPQWQEAIAAHSDYLIDPVPNLLSGEVTTRDTNLLANNGRVVRGVGADGVAQIVFRIPWDRVGERLTVTILNDSNMPSSSTDEDGALGPLGDSFLNPMPIILPVSTMNTTRGPRAFAVYLPPLDFSRNGRDDLSVQRLVSLRVRSLDRPTATWDETVPILRPPVFLVHGIWDDYSGWNRFTPLITDQRFFIRRVTYEQLVAGITKSDPVYKEKVLKKVRASALGFEYNASRVLEGIRDFIIQYRNTKQVASIQADIVAHSMGGLVTRLAMRRSSFLRSDTFQQGSIHKLITIGTSYLGTPLAEQLHLPSNTCVRNLLAGGGNIALRTVSIAGSPSSVRGATLDLEGDGKGGRLMGPLLTLQTPSPHPVPTAMIAGQIGIHNLFGLDCTFCAARYIRSCDEHGVPDPLATNLTSTNWPLVFGGSPSDAIVPLTSAFNNSSGITVDNRLHSKGVTRLSFSPPHLLQLWDDSGPPLITIQLLNESVKGVDFRPF